MRALLAPATSGGSGGLMRASVVRPDGAQWLDLLARSRHDFYHLPPYVALEAKRIGGEALALAVEDGARTALLPLVARDLPGALGAAARGWRDATSPYGYASPVFGGPGSDAADFHVAAVRCFAELLRDQGLVCAFVRLHPLLPGPAGARSSTARIVTHGPTVWLDLRQSAAELDAQTRATHRNLVRRALRMGYRAELDESWSRLPAFGAIYRATMSRLEAPDMYHFDDAYLVDFRNALGRHAHLWTVTLDNDVVAAGLFTECNGIVQYHLSGTVPGHERISPTRLLLTSVRDWAASRGNTQFHLGGGFGASEDGLFRFKAGFSHLRGEFKTLRLIGDEATFMKLKAAHAGGSAPSQSDYFPPYRQ